VERCTSCTSQPLCFINFETFYHLKTQLWMSSLEPISPMFSNIPFQKNTCLICMNLTIFNLIFFQCNVQTHFATTCSFCHCYMLVDSIFHDLVLPFKWHEKMELKGCSIIYWPFYLGNVPSFHNTITLFNCSSINCERNKTTTTLLIICVCVASGSLACLNGFFSL